MEEFATLPGIGRRSAERLAFYVLTAQQESALQLSSAIADVKRLVRNCSICFNFTEDDHCPVCSDAQREHHCVLVVEQPKDLISLERTGMYRGSYHVLMGHLAPLDGIGPDNLTADALLKRIDEPGCNAQGRQITEVIFGLSPNLEGDGTALFLADQLKSRQVKLTRLARGLPSGSQIEFANKAVLAEAIIGRQDVQ